MPTPQPTSTATSRVAVLAALLLVAAVLAGCGSDKGEVGQKTRAPRTVRVPADVPTISRAVAEAVPGDLILVSPGTYHEAVVVTVPGIEIRGLSRAGVVLDGGHRLEDGFRVTVPGVAIDDLTVQDYAVNGIVFDGSAGSASGSNGGSSSSATGSTPGLLSGFRASYVTALGNGLYGVYAFSFQHGEFDHIYASGSPDSGIYVGQCRPCDSEVSESLAEYNAIGYEGTNAGGNMYIVDSVWRRNRVGMTANTEDKEKLGPQRDATIAGNLVQDNDQANAPPVDEGGFGTGIAIAGGTHDQVVRNRVIGNSVAGIVVTDLEGHLPSDNAVRDNTLSGNGVDLVYGWQGASTRAAGNCFATNTFTTSRPARIERVLACSGTTDAGLPALALPAGPPQGSAPIPPPPSLPDLPHAATAPVRPARPFTPRVDLSTIRLPPAP